MTKGQPGTEYLQRKWQRSNFN